MTIETTKNKEVLQVVANESDYSWTGFRIDKDADLKVYLNDTLQTAGYSATGFGDDSGGTVTFTVPPDPGTWDTVTILREIAQTQSTNYRQYSRFPAEIIEDDYDRAAMGRQQLDERADRTLTYSVSEVLTEAQKLLPLIDALKGNLLSWDEATGAPVAVQLSDLDPGTVLTTAYTRGFLLSASEAAALSYLNAAGVNLANVFTMAQRIQAAAGNAKLELEAQAAPADQRRMNIEMQAGGGAVVSSLSDVEAFLSNQLVLWHNRGIWVGAPTGAIPALGWVNAGGGYMVNGVDTAAGNWRHVARVSASPGTEYIRFENLLDWTAFDEYELRYRELRWNPTTTTNITAYPVSGTTDITSDLYTASNNIGSNAAGQLFNHQGSAGSHALSGNTSWTAAHGFPASLDIYMPGKPPDDERYCWSYTLRQQKAGSGANHTQYSFGTISGPYTTALPVNGFHVRAVGETIDNGAYVDIYGRNR